MRRYLEQCRAKGRNPAVMVAYGLLIAVFLYAFAQFYIPGKGFSYLVAFGGKMDSTRLKELSAQNIYVQSDSDGYDAQYYVQIAMDPSLRNPQLKSAVDSLPYRARRILISAVSYAMGFGQPASILQAYALQNAISWLALAGILLWWFPPSGWSHFFRWAGVLFSFGVCVSLRNSLVDGPSLLLIALGVLAFEKGRPWLATAVLALSGLGKETNLLASSVFATREDLFSLRHWPKLLLRGVLVALPLVLWVYYIQRTIGPAADLGARNFDWPFFAYGHKWVEVLHGLGQRENWALGVANCGPFWSLLMLVTLTVQFLFLIFRPSPSRAWWRVGMSFAILMVVLGDAVWEGFPGAASRVLLPMQLAFNVLVPIGRGWWPLLILGNLTLLNAPIALGAPLGDGYKFTGQSQLLVSADGEWMRVRFGKAWHQTEQLKDRYWRWSRASSTITINNPHAFPVEANWSFMLAALDERPLAIKDEKNNMLWSGEIGDRNTPVEIGPLVLRPGDNVYQFITPDAPLTVTNDPRRFAFCVKGLVFQLSSAPSDGVIVIGTRKALQPVDGRAVKVNFIHGWHKPERQGEQVWRWTQGAAEWSVVNPQAKSVRMNLKFTLNGVSERRMELSAADGTLLWEGLASDRRSAKAELEGILLPPGETHFFFRSNQPPSQVPDDLRLLDFCVKGMTVEIIP